MKFRLSIIVISFLAILFITYACKKEKIQTIPLVQTLHVSEIGFTSLVCHGKVLSDGGSEILSQGICWSDSHTPTIEDNKSSVLTGIGSFQTSLSDLDTNTIYLLRAYATNNTGTAYGEEVVISTGAVADIDGNIYRAVKIGTQTWMVENLKTTKFNDGTPISYITDASEWISTNSPGYCWSGNNPADSSYGALYNYYAINESLCPPGWHVPDSTDWKVLFNYCGDQKHAGGKLKEKGLKHWEDPNIGALNSTGFTAIPGCFRNSQNGTFGRYGFFSYLWSKDGDFPNAFIIQYNTIEIKNQELPENTGIFIRCVRDEEEN